MRSEEPSIEAQGAESGDGVLDEGQPASSPPVTR